MKINIKFYDLSTYYNLKSNWLSLLKKFLITFHTFEVFKISKMTIFKILENSFTHLTKIQSVSIPFQICGFDIIGSSSTGSGKTLAFLIPSIEFLHTTKWKPSLGTAIIIISPTRELAVQTYYIFKDFSTIHQYRYGLMIGGSNKKSETEKVSTGLDIAICTPGRLLDHLNTNKNFKFHNLQILIIDEADRCLEVGFEEEIKNILILIPKKKQTIMFSATQTKTIKNLTNITFCSKPIFIGEYYKLSNSRNQTNQGFMITNQDNKFLSLITFLKKNFNKKHIVFFSSCNEVKYYALISKILNIEVIELHGKQKQFKRIANFFKFCKAKNSVLFSTDVSARGLDFPLVDWIIQFSPPFDSKEYIHRIGRTSRGIKNQGSSVIFIYPFEIGYLKYLENKQVKLFEYKMDMSNFKVFQSKINKLIVKYPFLNKIAKDAFFSYLKSYKNYPIKSIFNPKNLNLELISKNFGILN